MGTIMEQIDLALENKAKIKEAIINKGVNVEDIEPLSTYPQKIKEIGEWKPEPDWWDIKSIVEQDDKPKVAILFNDFFKTVELNQNDFFGAEKIVLSDGQEITEKGTVTINDNGLKECSKGYKTWYAIMHLNEDAIFRLGYYNPLTQYGRSAIWVYMYNVKELNCNSTFGLCISSFFEAFNSNKPVKMVGNNGFRTENAFNLRVIPKFDPISKGGSNYSYASMIQITNAPYIKKQQLMDMLAHRPEGENDMLGDMRTYE